MWYYLDNISPSDGQHCWIRLADNTYAPISSVFNLSQQTFIDDENKYVFPVNVVLKWKSK